MSSLPSPLPIGPALLLLSVIGSAFAGDPAATLTAPAAPSLDYLLTLGPTGALVWGAYMLGRGVKLTIQVELSDRDRELLTRAREKEQP